MALFNKEPDKNVRIDPNARVQPQPIPAAQPMTPTVVTTTAGPSEKPAMPMRPAPAPAASERAYLDSGSKISGKLSFDGPTRIDGQVDGEITGKDSLTILARYPLRSAGPEVLFGAPNLPGGGAAASPCRLQYAAMESTEVRVGEHTTE